MDEIITGIVLGLLINGVVYLFILKIPLIFSKIVKIGLIVVGIVIVFLNTFHLYLSDSFQSVFLKSYYDQAPIGRYMLNINNIYEYGNNFHVVTQTGSDSILFLYIENHKVIEYLKQKKIKAIPVEIIPKYIYGKHQVQKRFNIAFANVSRIASYDLYKEFHSSHLQNTAMGLILAGGEIILSIVIKKRNKNDSI